MPTKIKKAVTFLVLTLVMAFSLLFLKPVRTWAAQEGTYYWKYLYLTLITTANRRTCNSANEGGFMYDSTVHSMAFCDATSWHKLVSGTSANDTWTSY